MSKTFNQQLSKLTIESVIPLTQVEIDSIVSSLNINPGDVEVTNVKNADLIAGIRISYKGKMIDMSMQDKLNQLNG